MGPANLILQWSTDDDLDVHVLCPNGRRLFWNAPNECGADLQKDSQVGDIVANPIEDVRFSDASPPGEYVALVNRHDKRSGPSGGTPFTLRLLSNGSPVQTRTGTARDTRTPDGSNEAMRFRLPLQQQARTLPPECRETPGQPQPPGRRP